MKKLITVLALGVAVAAPSFAQAAPSRMRHIPANPPIAMIVQSPAVYSGGQYVGQDPDPNVRLEMSRDGGFLDGPNGG